MKRMVPAFLWLFVVGCGASEPEPFRDSNSGGSGSTNQNQNANGNANSNENNTNQNSNGGQVLSCDGQITRVPEFFFGTGSRVIRGTIELPSSIDAGTVANLFVRSEFQSNTVSFEMPLAGSSLTFAWCDLDPRSDYQVGAAFDANGDADVGDPEDWEGYFDGTVAAPLGLGFGEEIDVTAGDVEVSFGVNTL